MTVATAPGRAARQVQRRMPKSWTYMVCAGWQVEGFAGNGHIKVEREGDSTLIPATPSDVKSDMATRTRLRHRDRQAGRSAPGNKELDRQSSKDEERQVKLAADREANDRVIQQLEHKLLTTTHTPIVRPEPPAPTPRVVKPTGPRGPNERTRKAMKWLMWFVGRTDGPSDYGKVLAEGVRAGHADATVRRAVRLLGLRLETRGPGRSPLLHAVSVSEAEKTVEAVSHAAPSPSRSTESAGATSVDVDSAAQEWARLEGMAVIADASLGTNGVMAELVAKLRELTR